MATINGTNGDDTLTGTAVADIINGLAGNDILNGGDGNDVLSGGLGADALFGGAGTDTAVYSSAVTINTATGVHIGEAAGDTFDSIEIIAGSNSTDTFVSGAGADNFDGGGGTDILSYAASDAAVNVNIGTNTASGGYAQGDVIKNFERLVGSVFGDTLGSSGNGHVLDGGAGDDLYIVSGAGVVVSEAAGSGDDTVQTALATYTLGVNLERLTYSGAGAFSGIGNNDANVMTGGAGNDTLQGMGGDDTLYGGDGNDVLIGGAGVDKLFGGAGIDSVAFAGSVTINTDTGVHTGDAAGDIFDSIEIIQGSASSDTFISGAGADNFDSAGGVDILSYAASNAAVSVNITTNTASGGYAQGDVIKNFERVQGSAFSDTLGSTTSGHVLEGGAGDDLYIVGTGVTVIEAAGGGDDTVQTALATYTLGVNLERLTYSGAGAFSGLGNNDANIITGGVGNDTLQGMGGDDTLYGGDGNDALIGGAGADKLFGGAGIDSVAFAGSVTINMATGVHTGDAAGDIFDSIELIQGSNADDVFVAGAGADNFDGATGFDILSYVASDAAVNINVVTQTASGGYATGDTFKGFERFVGSAFDDTFTATTASAPLEGGAGNDTYFVTSAVALIESAGGGEDSVVTTSASYTLGNNLERLTYTGTVAFTGTGNAENNVITGGTGNDTLQGLGGDDTLYGGDGNDVLIGGAGADKLFGGAGTDTASYASAVTINMATGAHAGDAAGDTFDSIELIQGSAAADIFIAGAGADNFDGAAGTDTLSYAASDAAVSVNLLTGAASGGYAAGDTVVNFEKVVGSSFNDTFTSSNATLEGGAGDDTYVVSHQSVTIIEATSGGNDLVLTSTVSFTIADNIERLTYTGTGSFSGYGNASNNIITGGVGVDTLRGLEGDDVLNGGDGNDILIGGLGADVHNGGAGTDLVTYAAAAAAVTVDLVDGANAGEAAGDTYSDIENFTGSTFNDTFVSGAGIDRLDAGAGTADVISYAKSTSGVNVNLTTKVVSGGFAEGDVLTNFESAVGSNWNDTLASSTSGHVLSGGKGDDTYVVGHQLVTINEATDEGDDLIITTLATWTLAANFERLSYSGTSAFTGIGNGDDNVITGGVGADTLRGMVGDDTLNGGDGNDILIGGAGADHLVGGAGTDTVRYESQVTVDMATGQHEGDAAGDTFDGVELIQGSTSNDVFISGAGADKFDGNTGADTLSYEGSDAAVDVNLTTGAASGGYAQGDVITNFERVVGSAFGDTLRSNTTGQTLAGGAGDDVYYISGATVTVEEAVGGGIDTVMTTGGASLSSMTNVENLIFIGTGNFNGFGNAGDNTITTGDGNDNLNGRDGDDILNAGAGNDELLGEAGDDILNGGDGDDSLYGGAGADQLNGGAGTDTARYQTAVTINMLTGVHTGDAEGDTFNSIEVIQGSSLADVFVAGVGADGFAGGGGVDILDYAASTAGVNVHLTANTAAGGYAEGDTISGFETLIGTTFADTLGSATAGHSLQGGAGDDTYVIGATGVGIVDTSGDDTIQTTLATFSMAALPQIERLSYAGGASFSGTGNSLDNVITGGGAADTLQGGGGDDVLNGGGGNDTLIGDAGADTFNGGDGIDTVSYANATSAVTLDLAAGVGSGDAQGDTFNSIEGFMGTGYGDTIVSSAAAERLDGGAGPDLLSYAASTAAVNVNLTTNVVSGGYAEGDVIKNFEVVLGSAFNDTLTSTTSGHWLRGGDGDDTYVITTTGITITEGAGQGNDLISTTLANYSLGAWVEIERLTYTGSAAFTGTGSAGNNVLTGANGNDMLYGMAGADELNGAGGADQLFGGDGDDTLNGGVGDDILYGGAGADAFFGGDGTDTVSFADSASSVVLIFDGFQGGFTGDTFDSIEIFAGSNFNDTFIAGAAAHAIDGGQGVDLVSYLSSTSALTISVSGTGSSGIAAGDTYASIEIFEGSSFNDVFLGGTGDDTFIGGAGADSFFGGGAGRDMVWYLTSAAAVEIDLSTGAAFGGDATGDSFDHIFGIIGTNFADKLIGNGNDNTLEGGAGDDEIRGGAGNDIIFGYLGSNTGPVGAAQAGAQADLLYGGDGNDQITTSVDDIFSIADGGTGNDILTVYGGVALGGAGADRLVGLGSAYILDGGDDGDQFELRGAGEAHGGNGGDRYYVETSARTYITDTGTSGMDVVYLNTFNSASEVAAVALGSDLYISTFNDLNDNGQIDSGIVIIGYFGAGGSKAIEQFYTLDGFGFTI
jgi:Ca2+-binding RTX toxin-like protein